MGYIDIVDDSKYIIKLLEMELEKYKFQYRSFTDSSEYILKLKEQWSYEEYPILILLDIMMPKLSGYDIITIIKNDDRLKHIPVIVISVRNQTDDIIKCIKMGANDYIVKPFKTEDLIYKINKVLKPQKN